MATECRDALFAPEPVHDDADLLLGREAPPRLPADRLDHLLR